jgi:hypothetical protein
MAKVIKECKVKGKIFSLDIIPHNKKIYWNAPTDWKYGKISRETLLRKYNKFLKIITFYNGDSKKSLSKLKLKRIHFAFIDGSHDYEDVKKEFELINAKQNRGDIIIFDDSKMAKRMMQIKTDAYMYWCTRNGLDDDDEENWNSFCEFYNNQ